MIPANRDPAREGSHPAEERPAIAVREREDLPASIAPEPRAIGARSPRWQASCSAWRRSPHICILGRMEKSNSRRPRLLRRCWPRIRRRYRRRPSRAARRKAGRRRAAASAQARRSGVAEARESLDAASRDRARADERAAQAAQARAGERPGCTRRIAGPQARLRG